jgi:hypothetical protein
MTVLILIIWLLLALGLLFVTAIRPVRTKHSSFELSRKGDTTAIDRERLLGDIYAYRRMLAVLLVMTLTIIGWVALQERGIIIVLVGLPVVMLLSRWGPVDRYVMGLYSGQERHLLGFANRWPTLGWLLGSDRRTNHDQRVESQEHLVHLVESAGHVLSEQQQRLIKRSLNWHGATIEEVMTPAKDIVSVSDRELLGPLVLNDLHKSGHHRFPVIHKDIDQVLGMVNISDLLQVDAIQKSHTADKAMTPIDVRLPIDTTLPHALKSLLAHPSQLGLVVDDDDKTVISGVRNGIITFI